MRGLGEGLERKRRLLRAGSPAAGFADRGERVAMQGRGAVLTQRRQVLGGGIPFVLRQAVLRVDGVPFFHAGVAMRL